MNGSATWTSMAVGVYLLCCRYLVGGPAEAVWSTYLAGAAVLVAGSFAIALPPPRWVLAVRMLSGTWLLTSPFALGFAGVPAASALIAGVLLLATGRPRRVLFCLVGYESCADDMVTLAAMVAKEHPKSGAMRRLKLRMVRGEALHSLARAREALPDRAMASHARL